MSAFETTLLAYTDWALLALRIVVGVIFLVHGRLKASPQTGGLKGYSAMIGQMMKMPSWIAGLVGYSHGLVEIIGGFLMMFGLFARIWAIPFALIMLLAIIVVKVPQENVHFMAGEGEMTGWEFDLLILASLVVLFVFGGGSIGLDSILSLPFE